MLAFEYANFDPSNSIQCVIHIYLKKSNVVWYQCILWDVSAKRRGHLRHRCSRASVGRDGGAHQTRGGEEFIQCFSDYHTTFTPEERQWTWTSIANTVPTEWLRTCLVTPPPIWVSEVFNTTGQNVAFSTEYSERFVLNGTFDPRDGDEGLEYLEDLHENYEIPGVKLYTAEWRGDSTTKRRSTSSRSIRNSTSRTSTHTRDRRSDPSIATRSTWRTSTTRPRRSRSSTLSSNTSACRVSTTSAGRRPRRRVVRLRPPVGATRTGQHVEPRRHLRRPSGGQRTASRGGGRRLTAVRCICS